MKKKIAIIVSVILLVAALITGCFFGGISNNPDENSDITSTTSIFASESSLDTVTKNMYLAADGDLLVYSSETKTLIISGEIIDIDIKKLKNKAECAEWFENAERIVISEGVTECDTSFEPFINVKEIDICSTMHCFSASHKMPSLKRYNVATACEKYYSDELGILYLREKDGKEYIYLNDIPYNIKMTDFSLTGEIDGIYDGALLTRNIKRYYFDKNFSIKTIPDIFEESTNIEFYEVHPENKMYCSDSQGIMYSKDKTKIYGVPCTVEELIMPENSSFYFSDYYFHSRMDISKFVNSSVKKITVSGNMYDFSDLLCFANLEEIVIPETNEDFFMVDGVVYSKDMSQLVFYPPMKKEETYVTPSCVKLVDYCAFGNKYLKNIVISDSVTEISSGAFKFADNLETIKIGKNVEKIGCFSVATFDTYNPFEFTDNLKFITVDKDNMYYCNDEHGNLYTKDMKLLMTYPAASPYKEFTVPDSVEEIGYAFVNCRNLEVINIGKNTTNINWYLYCEYGYGHGFEKCTSLKAINFSEDNSEYCSQNGIVFSKNMSKIILYPQGKTEDFYVIPESVNEFRYGSYGTFYNNTYLKTIYVTTSPFVIVNKTKPGDPADEGWLPELKLSCDVYCITEDGKTFVKTN